MTVRTMQFWALHSTDQANGSQTIVDTGEAVKKVDGWILTVI